MTKDDCEAIKLHKEKNAYSINGTECQREFIVVGIAFTIFFAVISYNLTHAGLWYDETIEYWYSKYFFGTVPWENEAMSMYDRILATYQPPLFNVLLHFWLGIHDAEWWMRLFGVMMGMVGAVGLYKTLLFGSESRYKASIAVVMYAFIYHLTYYWQEVAEYALMLGFLSWTIYYFLLVNSKPNVKRIILFVVSCIIPVYSQYGAAFLVLAFAILAYVKIVQDKDKKNIVAITGSYAAAAIFFALPLYLFFLKPQMEQQETIQITRQSFSVKNFWDDFISIFEWNFTNNIGRTGHHVISIIVTLMIIAAILYIIKGQQLWMKYLLVANMICYSAYYFAAFFGVYTIYYSNQFANRYNLFLIPIWFVTALLLIDLIFKETAKMNYIKYVQPFLAMMAGGTIAVLVCWSYLGWTSLSNNWYKEDIRGATEKWINETGYETDTIIYQRASSGFSYYIMHSSKYNDSILDKVVFQNEESSLTCKSDEKEWVDKVYGEEWPSSLYIVVSHEVKSVSLENLVKTFTNDGYTSTDIYDENGARLIYLEKK